MSTTMPEYIEREAAIRICENLRDSNVENADMAFALNWAAESIKRLPAADVAPERSGRWRLSDKHKGYAVCSECENCYIDPAWLDPSREKWEYCPTCGARMGEADVL